MAGTDADPQVFPSVFACMRPPASRMSRCTACTRIFFACTRIPERTSLAHPVWRNIYII